MFRALLFDLDDTLYGFAPCDEVGLVAAHTVLARHFDIGAPDFRALHDRVRRDVAERLSGQAASHSRTLFFKSMLEELTGGCRGDLAVRMTDGYWDAFLDHMTPGPHTHDVLARLGATCELALVTNQTADVQLRKIRKLGLEPYFAVVVTSEECGIEKPDARVFQRALTALGVAAEEAVMVGDDPERDIRGASELGLYTVQTTEFASTCVGGHEVPPTAGVDGVSGSAAADVVVGALHELPDALAVLR